MARKRTQVAVGALVVAGLCGVIWTVSSLRSGQDPPVGNTETAQSQQPDVPQPSASASVAEPAYQEIVEAYHDVLHMDSQVFLAAPETYFHGDYEVLNMYHENQKYHEEGAVFYTCYDIDGNGVEELLIGFGWSGWINEKPGAAQLVDLYTFDGTQAIEVIRDPVLVVSASVGLLEDDTLLYISEDEDGNTVFTYYQLEGSQLREIQSTTTQPSDIQWKANLGWKELG